MRTQHTLHSLPAFPVYSAGFLSETRLVVGGGGGTGRSGIRNKLVSMPLVFLAHVDEYLNADVVVGEFVSFLVGLDDCRGYTTSIRRSKV